MANFCADHEIVTKFLFDTCHICSWLNTKALMASLASLGCPMSRLVSISSDGDETRYIRVTTGSAAEFYIEPMLSCVGDIDIMSHRSDQLVIPAGTAPPTQLPDEFHSRVEVSEIVDSEFPCYVYLVSSYLLTECIDDGKYSAAQCHRQYQAYEVGDRRHGPAVIGKKPVDLLFCVPCVERLPRSHCTMDSVDCVRCLLWPSQAADWPTQHRNYDWPDSATVDRVVSNGCDVVGVAHRRCRQDEWMNTHQWRLSFSRAEIVLLNSWIPVQQIVYHVLRVFVKTERLTDSANNSDVATLSNYHIKTLMLWACELKPRSWWIDDLNVVGLSVELLHTLGVWLTDARCPHYFIHNCNLFGNPDNCYCEIASQLMSALVGLTHLVIRSYVDRANAAVGILHSTMYQLPLSLYLMTQCQMKLHHPVTSLAQTLDDIINYTSKCHTYYT